MHSLININPLGQNLVFVGGSARSGTTLVQNIIDSHPEVFGGPEFLHIPEIIKLRNDMQRSVSRGWIDLICSNDDVDSNFRELILNFLVPFAKRHEGKILSEKTPENVLVFKELAELLPDSKLILVVRDPRAIVASMQEVGRRARKKGLVVQDFTRSTPAAIKYIKRCMGAGFKALQQAPERVMVIVYEELVRDPELIARKICDFLLIEWDSAMCFPGEKKHLGEQAITAQSNELWYSSDQYRSNPNTESLEKWKTVLSSGDKVYIASAFKNYHELTDLGYNFSMEGIPFLMRIWGTFIYTCGRLQRLFLKKTQRKSRGNVGEK